MSDAPEILRFVDTLHRDKEIDKELIFQAIEAAYLTSVRRKLGESETLRVDIDRESGEIGIFDGDDPVEVEDIGRIAASTGKQVLLQKIREAERDVIFDEYADKVKTLVSGVVQRLEGPNMIVSLGRVEGLLPRSEQVPGERFRVGERIKILVQDIRKNGNRVQIILSRTSPDLVRRLFELEVPEISDKTIEVKGISREPGYRTKIAVTTYDPNVDCVGACVGVRGSRIKNIVDELFGEKIDIVRWNESIEVLIMNALKPAEISSMDLDFDQSRAKVYVKSDQQSIAIGKRGQNVRLASKMAGWDIDIVMVSDEELDKMRTEGLDADGLPIAIGVLGDSADSEDEAATDEAATDEAATDEAATDEATTDEAATDEATTDEEPVVDLGTDQDTPDEPSSTVDSETVETIPDESAGDDQLEDDAFLEDAAATVTVDGGTETEDEGSPESQDITEKDA